MAGFLDSNILVYAFSVDERALPSRDLLEAGNHIGIQSLNEFANVALRRLRFDRAELDLALARIRDLCPEPQLLALSVHENGLRLGRRYGFSLYDSMIVAAALAADCDILWSEDMHDGLVVEDRLAIRNPFV